MENTASKVEALKPVILKAGVPLAVSLAGFVYAWIITRRNLSKASSTLTQSDEVNVNNPSEINYTQRGIVHHEESFHSLASMEDDDDDDELGMNMMTLRASLEQEICGLRSKIEGLQMRELALSLQFDRYCDMKEQESLLVEIRNLLSLETARVEFLDKEVSSMEEENKKLETLLVQHVRIIGQLDDWKSENRLLQRKLRRVQRKSRAQSNLIKEQTLKIKAQQDEILENHEALQTRIDNISQLEDEIREMHRVLEELLEEKNELVKKLEATEKSYASKIKAGEVSKEEHERVVNEMEQLKKERGEEVKELIYLRWSNACLRHEVLRQQEQKKNEEEGVEFHYEESEHELNGSPLMEHHQNMPCFGSAHTHIQSEGACSRRKKLINRLKRWVEGSEKARVKPEEKDRHYCASSYGAEEAKVPARRSCSSA